MAVRPPPAPGRPSCSSRSPEDERRLEAGCPCFPACVPEPGGFEPAAPLLEKAGRGIVAARLGS